MAANSGSFGRILEPGLRKIFFETYKERAPQYNKIFNVLTSTKAVETDHRLGGFSMWNEKGTQDSTEYEDMLTGDPLMYRHKTFSKGFQIEKELYDDAQYNVFNKRAKALARAARSTIETLSASVLNDSFTVNGYDGVPLFSDAHPRLDGGTVVDNKLSGGSSVLSESSLEAAYELAAEQVDERGLKIEVLPRVLVVPRALEMDAKRIIKSVQSTSATTFAKNDINVFKDEFQIVVLDYLTSKTAWFLMDPTYNELNFFWREKLNFKNTTDFDTDIAKYKGRMRFSYGYSDFRGWIGSTGV